jgi:hypothetical protein
LNSYILIFYWLFTILATVGYGDFTGGTTAEYLVTIAIEFMGIIVFAFLVFLMNKFLESGLTYELMIESKFGQLEEWIVKVEKCNWPRNLEP